MRKGLGAVVVGLGLALSIALPAAAQDTLTLEAGDQVLTVGPDGASIDPVDTRTPQEQFTDAFVACTAESGISDCTEAALAEIGLETVEGETVDNTPYNPVDEGSIEFIPETTIEAGPPV